jgi:hypothetical protein
LLVLIILYSLYLQYDSPLVPYTSGLAGWMAELHCYYPSSPSDVRKKASTSGKYISYTGNGMKSRRARRPLLLRHQLPAGSYSFSVHCAPTLSPLLVLRTNFPTSMAARKSITAWSHFSMESSSETVTCQHLPALHPIAFLARFQSVFFCSIHRLQWRRRCSRVWAVLLRPPHHQNWSASRGLNSFRYVPTGPCPDFRW